MPAVAAYRWPLACICLPICAICMWGAAVLPWRSWTTFALFTAGVGGCHGVTGILALLGRPQRMAAWRLQSAVSLGFVAWITWNTWNSATYIAALYGGLGSGVAVALGLAWLLVALLFTPMAIWGLVTTGIRLRARRTAAAALLVPLLLVAGAWRNQAAAQGLELESAKADESELMNLVQRSVSATGSRNPPANPPRSLMTSQPATCPGRLPDAGVTAFVTYVAGAESGTEVRHECVQSTSLETLKGDLTAALAQRVGTSPVVVDVVTHTRELDHLAPVVDGLLLRPGLDGVCDENACLAPWQLVARDMFTEQRPIPVVPEFRFGFAPFGIRRLLHTETSGNLEVKGLLAFSSLSFTANPEGELVPIRRLKTRATPLTRETLRQAKRAAERYIFAALGDDGRFAYRLDPFAGRLSYAGFSLARQAGTTLAVCELAEDREQARRVATDALAMLASTARAVADGAVLYFPPQKQVDTVRLGDTALATIAFLSCRNLVGEQFDPDIDRFTRFLLHMQRPDGSFYPSIDMHTGLPIPGPDPLYAVGQAVFALTLLEQLSAETPDPTRFVAHDQVRTAVEAAMDYVAEKYWSGFMTDFFYLEENWHCLAARASLGHHRHDGYERFCLDYVTFKRRVILDEDSDVDDDLLGGYGFGNVLIPHNTGASGYGEAASAALAVAAARGENYPEIAHGLELALGFLIHQQWNQTSCFACSTEYSAIGGFSEHMGSPHIRIDYVQHAMAAMGHGGRQLGLADWPTSASRPVHTL